MKIKLYDQSGNFICEAGMEKIHYQNLVYIKTIKSEKEWSGTFKIIVTNIDGDKITIT